VRGGVSELVWVELLESRFTARRRSTRRIPDSVRGPFGPGQSSGELGVRMLPARLLVALQCLRSLRSEGNGTGANSFTGDSDNLVIPVEVANGQPGDLCEPEPPSMNSRSNAVSRRSAKVIPSHAFKSSRRSSSSTTATGTLGTDGGRMLRIGDSAISPLAAPLEELLESAISDLSGLRTPAFQLVGDERCRA
jgi:hypothetical protein